MENFNYTKNSIHVNNIVLTLIADFIGSSDTDPLESLRKFAIARKFKPDGRSRQICQRLIRGVKKTFKFS